MRRLICRRLPAMLLLVLIAAACHKKPVPITGPVGPAIPESLIQEFVLEGDKLFEAMHLYAWRRAEAAYATAYSMAPRPEIRDKLALAKLLRMTREIDEDIPCPTVKENIAFICEHPADARAQALCDLAGAYALTPQAAAESMKRVDPAVLHVDTSPLDAYFYALYARTIGSDAKDDTFRRGLHEKYKNSPLFAYLGSGLGVRLTQQYPDFAEACQSYAESSFQKNSVKAARTGFTHALAFIPEYTRAQNGLANIYFFTLEDYDNAFKGYEASLRWDPQNTGALFGKGASLHHLDRYQESNAVMDQMLASDLSRNGRVTSNSIQYYRGEAYYYKAHNYHMMNDPVRARELIDIAKKELPRAEEINYLSGLLYYIAGELAPAKADFEKSVKSGTYCYAYHYLGMIELSTGGPVAASNFLSCSACLERGLRNLQERMKAIAGLDIEPNELLALRMRMDLRLREYRDSSVDLIQRMVALIRDASMDAKWKQTFVDSMNGLLAKIQSIGGK